MLRMFPEQSLLQVSRKILWWYNSWKYQVIKKRTFNVGTSCSGKTCLILRNLKNLLKRAVSFLNSTLAQFEQWDTTDGNSDVEKYHGDIVVSKYVLDYHQKQLTTFCREGSINVEMIFIPPNFIVMIQQKSKKPK